MVMIGTLVSLEESLLGHTPKVRGCSQTPNEDTESGHRQKAFPWRGGEVGETHLSALWIHYAHSGTFFKCPQMDPRGSLNIFRAEWGSSYPRARLLGGKPPWFPGYGRSRHQATQIPRGEVAPATGIFGIFSVLILNTTQSLLETATQSPQGETGW